MISPPPFGAAADFKLSITQALADQLAERLRPLRPAPLSENSLAQVENRPGVYELFLADQRVYVGKASRSLPARLRNHARKLSGRTGRDTSEITADHFDALYPINVNTTVDLTPGAWRVDELVLTALPVGWQLTILPGYAILYQETIDYQTALAWWRSTATGVVETAGPAHTASPASDQPLFSEEPEDDDDPEGISLR